jgi:transcriptional regulator with XRE-family HTH domain
VGNVDVCKVVGQRVRETRLRNEYKQEALARDLGISQSMLSRMESGTTPISVDILSEVGRKFHTYMSFFLSGLTDYADNEETFGDLTLRELSYLFSMGEYTDMLELIERAEGAEYFQPIHNHVKLGCWKARAFARLRDWNRSLQISEPLLDYLDVISDPYWQVFVLYNVGVAQSRLMNTSEASRIFHEANQRLKEKDDSEIAIHVMYNQGIFASLNGEWENVDNYLNRASDLHRGTFLQSCHITGRISHALAYKFMATDDLQTGLEYVLHAKKWFEVSQSTQDIMETVNNFAVCLDGLGRQEEARLAYQECANLARANRHLVRDILRDSLKSEGFELE